MYHFIVNSSFFSALRALELGTAISSAGRATEQMKPQVSWAD